MLPDRIAFEKLRRLCDISAKLWNEVNYVRRRMFFETKKIDLRGTYREFYEKYKRLIGSATTQQILNKNDEAWRSFFSLLKAKKEGKLPPFTRKVNPPGYRKRGGRRVLWTVLRNDQYKIDGDYIIIKGLGAVGSLRIKYSGRIHIRGKQGRAEIRYDLDQRRWYIHVSYEVEEKTIRNTVVKVPQEPLGDKTAGVDVGVNNLLAVYVEDGSAMLVSGRPLKAISFYWRSRIAEYQSTLNRYGLKTSRRLRLMFKRWRRQIRSYIDWAVRNTIEWLYQRGVRRIYVGYPKYVAQEPSKSSKANFEIVHVWSYGYLLRRLEEVGEEYGMEVVLREEAYTSTTCPLCRTHIGHRRVTRGLLKCYKYNKVFNADLVGAFNMIPKPITPSPALSGVGVTGPETRPGAKPGKSRECSPKPPSPEGESSPFGAGRRSAPRLRLSYYSL